MKHNGVTNLPLERLLIDKFHAQCQKEMRSPGKNSILICIVLFYACYRISPSAYAMQRHISKSAHTQHALSLRGSLTPLGRYLILSKILKAFICQRRHGLLWRCSPPPISLSKLLPPLLLHAHWHTGGRCWLRYVPLITLAACWHNSRPGRLAHCLRPDVLSPASRLLITPSARQGCVDEGTP